MSSDSDKAAAEVYPEQIPVDRVQESDTSRPWTGLSKYVPDPGNKQPEMKPAILFPNQAQIQSGSQPEAAKAQVQKSKLH